MHVQRREMAPQREGEGLISSILLQKGDFPGCGLAVTWVEVRPGGKQKLHSHEPQQAYVIVKGRGRMKVGDDQRNVEEGDLIYLPAGVMHGIENSSDEVLEYVSAATPALDLSGLYDAGPLSVSDERR